ncbi:MAG: ornithine carbamoyltransferase, partial [Anaerolineales bacterium]
MEHFLAISDLSSDELNGLIDLAIELKKAWREGGNEPVLKDKVLAMVFQKPSLRTRVSFDMAMRHLGGDALYLSPNEIGLGKREAIADVSRVLSGYVQAIMARVFAHEHILELAKYASVP